MELRDLVVTPLWLILFLVGAIMIRSKIKDSVIRQYFLPALIVRLIGALAVGLIYQFYYGGGDTFNYHTLGSRIIWEAFIADPVKGVRLFLQTPSADYLTASQIIFFNDPASFALIRIAAFFDLFTASAYSATALFFGVVSFVGAWALFLTFYKQYPQFHYPLAIATLFVPSVFFWGSGVLKDTVTLAALEVFIFCTFRLAVERELRVAWVAALLLSVVVISSIKIYLLLSFLPCVIIVLTSEQLKRLRSTIARITLAPFAIGAAASIGFFAVTQATADDPRYRISQLAETARVTAMDIRYYSGKDAGSGYDLGTLDGSWQSVFRLAPAAINVSLFRPYLWEVRNPLMLLSSIEALVMLALTIYLLARYPFRIFDALKNPWLLFCLLFSLSMAVAVGVSTYNFGTLNRYKIPLIPFYLCFLLLLASEVKKPAPRR